MIDQANHVARMKASRHRAHVFQTIALGVLDQVPTGPTTGHVKAILVDLVIKELAKTQPNPETYHAEINSSVLSDENVNAILNDKVV